MQAYEKFDRHGIKTKRQKMDITREWIEFAAQGIETLAVLIMVLFITVATIRWIFSSAKKIRGGYERYRIVIGKTLLVGLELLVAADIIRTIALDLTLLNIALLAALVVVRTFLGWTLTVEVEGRWPWQKVKEPDPLT
jgi:uncharacterized membrane protein